MFSYRVLFARRLCGAERPSRGKGKIACKTEICDLGNLCKYFQSYSSQCLIKSLVLFPIANQAYRKIFFNHFQHQQAHARKSLQQKHILAIK